MSKDIVKYVSGRPVIQTPKTKPYPGRRFQVQIPTYKFRNQEFELETNRHLNLCRKALRLGWIDEFYEWKENRIYYFEVRILGDVEEKTKQLKGMFPQLMEPKDGV